MNISPINILKEDAYKIRTYSSHKNNVQNNASNLINEKQKVYASHLNFKSTATIPVALINEYKHKVHGERVLPIEAFLKLNAPKEVLEKMFCYILNNDETRYDFIDSIIKTPRMNKHYSKALIDKLPTDSEALNFFNTKNSYTKAYGDYINSRYQNARSVSELLKIRPDWSEEVLLKKHRELYYNDDFELGFVPQSIGAENFNIIIEYLRKFCDYGFKTASNINDLTINGRTFKFKKFIDGKSNKNVFLVESPEKKYIVKIGDPLDKGLNKPFAIGTCSIIDTYLTQNNCRNSAPIRYYNHNTNTAIYDFIEHKYTSKIDQISGFKENMPDFDDLGLRHNDTVGVNNYFLLDKDQKAMSNTYDFDYGVKHEEYVSVDNDHVNYTQQLNPKIQGFHVYLPNAMQMFF